MYVEASQRLHLTRGFAEVWMPARNSLYFPPMHRLKWLGILLFAAGGLGCSRVQRTVSLNSDPPGALVILNDQEIGRTPVTRDFIWYGWYDLVLRKEGYKTLKTRAEVIAPVWQWVPFDLAAEFVPVRLKDRHELMFKLEPEAEPPTNEDMLARTEQLRIALQGSQFTRNPATRPVTRPSTTQSTQPSTTQSTQPATTESTQPITVPSTTP
jgi:hypothetical protein